MLVPTTTWRSRSSWPSCRPVSELCSGGADLTRRRPRCCRSPTSASTPTRGAAWRAGAEIELSKTEFDLIELLVRNAGIVLDHTLIYERIWNYDFGPDSKNLAVYISYLRRKIDAGDLPKLIHTVRGVGYTVRGS